MKSFDSYIIRTIYYTQINERKKINELSQLEIIK